MGAIYAADTNRSCLQMSEERSGYSSDPSSIGASGGSSYPGRVPGILSDRNLEVPAPGARTWTDTESSAGEASRDPNAGCLFSNRGWPPIGDAALHRTRSRASNFTPSPQPHPPAATASPHHHTGLLDCYSPTRNVVETYGLPLLKIKEFSAADVPNCESWVKCLDWHDRISVDPRILVGKPVVKGTRISVEMVVDLLAPAGLASRFWTVTQL